ncbi:MAG TPA: carboxypeptidase regulatory-like domain-containing protein [Bryobacteraceae bacterium]|nr:carboxypeptidase regulatory-like domain-containing protein [Bryobacteraceae bacterium]
MSFSRPLFALILLTVPLLAQTSSTASLAGDIKDPSGSLIPQIDVIVSDAHAVTRTATSDAQGHYQFNGLPPGSYTIRVNAPGFTPYELSGLAVASGRANTLNITLALQAQAEQVTVAASASVPQLDTEPSNNADALVLEKTDMDSLPDDPDDLSADLQALAGPAAGPDGGQVFIDGFTGGRLPPKDSIREIRVNQNPFSAQYDHPGHGRIEILTKPGSDLFHGDALFLFSDAALNSRNPFVTDKPPYQRRQWEGELGGPLGKKTSFFLDFERRDINENAFVNALTLDSAFNITPFTQAVVTPLTGTEGNIKIDHQLTTNHTLTLRYGFARDTNDNAGVGGFSLPERGYHVDNRENTFQLIETGVLNVHTVNESRFRFHRQATDQGGGSTAPIVSVLDAFTAGGSPVGHSFDNQNRYEVQNFTTQTLGTHTIRWGGLLRAVTLEDQAMQNYSGAFTFTSLAAYRLTLLGMQQGLTPAQIRASGGGASQFSLMAGNPLANVNQYDYGLFIQDDWRARQNLTISAGLRYEAQNHTSDHSDFAPRVGFAWGVGSSGSNAPKTVIRGGAGIFYNRLRENFTLNALRQNGVIQQSFLVPTPDFYPTIPTVATLMNNAVPQTIRETDANWQAPMLLQTSIGVERQLPKHVTVSTNYIHSSGVHNLRSRDINAPLPGTGIFPYGGTNGIYLYESSGIYRQNQLITSVNARISSRFSLFAFYAWGSAMSNTDGPNSFPANQYDLSSEYGRSGWDIHHRLQFHGSVETKWGIRFSPFMTITSGRPFNIITGTDLNGDGIYLDRPAFVAPGVAGANIRVTPYGAFDLHPMPGETIIPRNFAQGPGLISVNMRVSKTFVLGESKNRSGSRELVFAVNARNFINHPNLGQPSGDLSSPLFGQSTTLINGGGASGNRRLDLQVRFNF